MGGGVGGVMTGGAAGMTAAGGALTGAGAVMTAAVVGAGAGHAVTAAAGGTDRTAWVALGGVHPVATRGAGAAGADGAIATARGFAAASAAIARGLVNGITLGGGVEALRQAWWWWRGHPRGPGPDVDPGALADLLVTTRRHDTRDDTNRIEAARFGLVHGRVDRRVQQPRHRARARMFMARKACARVALVTQRSSADARAPVAAARARRNCHDSQLHNSRNARGTRLAAHGRRA